MTMSATLRAAYAAAFTAYLDEPGEEALRLAYELGRDAVAEESSVLELAATHHELLGEALGRCPSGDAAQRLASAAADFLLESLSAFEMVQRGFREAREAALLEQRQGAMLRRLSAFLADAALALSDAESLLELLQLVAEQARELTGADSCVAGASLEDANGTPQAICSTEDGSAWAAADADALYACAVRIAAPAARASAAELERDPAAVELAALLGVERLRGHVAAPLTGIAGREIGSIHLFDKSGPGFSELDEGLLLHLAQMASAALERAELYARERRLAEALARSPAAAPPRVTGR